MKRLLLPGLAFLAACGNPAPPVLTPAAQAAADGGRPRYTRADVEFMAGMIGHHAQAVIMAGWAASHGAGIAVQRLAGRIVVGQRDEIGLMESWLRERNEPVPGADSSHAGMPGMAQYPQMPGMLTPQELERLNQSRGAEFDRLFLTFMIRHHQGAITMVEKLFGSHGAAQDEIVFKFASDVHVDQITEIEFMSGMLANLRAEGPKP